VAVAVAVEAVLVEALVLNYQLQLNLQRKA
jgi:hypothetical protein